MKSILITGATSGIGEALAYYAAEQNYRVIACGRNPQKLAALAQHPNIVAAAFDVCNEEQSHTTLRSIKADIYVFNAGVCEYVDVNNIDIKLFKRVFDANFFGIVNCIAGVTPHLKSGDQIVIVDSLARLLPFTKSEAYGASKAALHYFSKSLSVDLTNKNVLLQSVSPGFVDTPLTKQNDFAMPMQISVDQAAKRLLHGIEKKQTSIYFPTLFALVLRALHKLPTLCQVWLAKKLKNT